MKVFSLFFALRQRKRHAVSQYTRSPSAVQWYKPPTSDGLEKQHWPLGRNRQAGPQPAQLRTASAMVALVCCGSPPVHRTHARVRGRAEAVLRLLPNESESGIVAQ